VSGQSGGRQHHVDRADRFDDLYRTHYLPVLRYARRRADPDTAGDVVAETFLIAWRRLDSLPAQQADVLPWLFGVARRVLANAERSRRRASRVTERLGQHSRGQFVPDAAGQVSERDRLTRKYCGLSAGRNLTWPERPSPWAAHGRP
jgi:DNA-directed RNA polymerase specialized sigma24 family protein